MAAKAQTAPIENAWTVAWERQLSGSLERAFYGGVGASPEWPVPG